MTNIAKIFPDDPRLTAYALGELEGALDCEIDGDTVATHDVDSLIALAEGEESER